MKKTIITILSLVILIGSFLIFYKNRPLEQKKPVINQTDQQTSTKQNWESKIDDQTAVTVTITPTDILSQSKEWKFSIVMDTHSVELDQDLIKSAILIDDMGKEYKPRNWEGPVGGHHREGVLVFNAIQPMPKSVEIKIKDVGGIQERSFKWDLK
ncbi:MAG: hypothetical protein WC621_04155 [Patescibacteria group bacterium]